MAFFLHRLSFSCTSLDFKFFFGKLSIVTNNVFVNIAVVPCRAVKHRRPSPVWPGV